MRVISGTARGRKLKEPAADSTIRPTNAKVKESIFNIIQFDIEGRQVLDLFAGTGQLGIEALSRGAKNVTFVDASNESVKIIRDNLRVCGFSDLAMVYTADVVKYLQYKEKYDIILIDPPYDSGLAEKAVKMIIEFDKLNENGIIICETSAQTATFDISPPYELKKQYKYGRVVLTKITREPCSGGI